MLYDIIPACPLTYQPSLCTVRIVLEQITTHIASIAFVLWAIIAVAILIRETRALSETTRLLDEVKRLNKDSREDLRASRENLLWCLFLSEAAEELIPSFTAFEESNTGAAFDGAFAHVADEVRTQMRAFRLVQGTWDGSTSHDLQEEEHAVRAQITIWRSHNPELFRSERLNKLRL